MAHEPAGLRSSPLAPNACVRRNRAIHWTPTRRVESDRKKTSAGRYRARPSCNHRPIIRKSCEYFAILIVSVGPMKVGPACTLIFGLVLVGSAEARLAYCRADSIRRAGRADHAADSQADHRAIMP
jgi:hypothetical protein